MVNNNSCGRLFPSSIYRLILRVVPVLFSTAVLSFLVAYSSILHLLYYIQPFICTINDNNNNNNNDNNNNNNNHNHNENDDDNENENENENDKWWN